MAEASGKLANLLYNPLQIVAAKSWVAITYRVDPKDAIMLGQQRHDMFFAEWISVPIVGKTDNVLSL